MFFFLRLSLSCLFFLSLLFLEGTASLHQRLRKKHTHKIKKQKQKQKDVKMTNLCFEKDNTSFV